MTAVKGIFTHTKLYFCSSIFMSKDQDILERELWDALRNGDQSALRKLYLSYYQSLLQYGLKYTNHRDTLKDSINSTFLYIWDKRASLSTANNVGNYIFKSYQRQLVRDLQQNQTFDTLSTIDNDEITYDAADFQLIMQQEEVQRVAFLKNAILKLPKRQRELIHLRYYEGLSYEEIALKTQLTKRTVYNQIHTAISTLKNDTDLQNLKKLLSLLIFF